MSIADKLTYLNGTKSLLREAINAAGGNLTQETPFREYAEGWLRDQSASLILDFSKQQCVAKDKVSMFPDRVGFEDIVTFTRASGGGRFNGQGQYEWVGPDEPRIDYDPVTGECLGLLVEEQRTNLLRQSNNLASTRWNKLLEATVEPSSVVAPDGTATAFKVSFAAYSGSTGSRIEQAVAMGAGEYCQSVWLRTESGTLPLLIGTSAGVGVTTVIVTESWQRFEAPIRSSGSSVYPRIANISGAEASVLVWGNQLEAGTFPTSYIPTEDAQVTRAADIATVNDLAPWYGPNQGSFSIKAKGHIGEPLLAAGDALIIADSDELKEYQVSYSEDPQATQVDIGKGLIESIRYWPRETA